MTRIVIEPAALELGLNRDAYEALVTDLREQGFEAELIHWDIVPNERIVYTYEMLMDETRVSVSLARVALAPEGEGTRLTVTEHGAFFDGLDTPTQREHGTGSLLDALERALQDNPV